MELKGMITRGIRSRHKPRLCKRTTAADASGEFFVKVNLRFDGKVFCSLERLFILITKQLTLEDKLENRRQYLGTLVQALVFAQIHNCLDAGALLVNHDTLLTTLANVELAIEPGGLFAVDLKCIEHLPSG